MKAEEENTMAKKLFSGGYSTGAFSWPIVSWLASAAG